MTHLLYELNGAIPLFIGYLHLFPGSHYIGQSMEYPQRELSISIILSLIEHVTSNTNYTTQFHLERIGYM